MSFFRIENLGLAISNAGVFSINLTPPEPSTDIIPALSVEYVDTSGDRQTTSVVDGVTTITGIAPFSVQFDASGTRAPTAFAAQGAIADEEAYAYLMCGYRINYGDGGGSWSYPEGTSYAQQEDTGPPLFVHTFKNAGTHHVRLKVRDAQGRETTISMHVVVNAPPAATHIPTSQGSWPSWTSGARYTLQADGNYTSFGDMEFGAHHGIIAEKTGSGADPIVSGIRPENRSRAAGGDTRRSANLRFINLDIGNFTEELRGFDHVTILGGIMRRYTYSALMYFWHEGTEATRSLSRYSRGLFIEGCDVRNSGTTDKYIMFGMCRGLHVRNSVLRHIANGDATYSMIRMYGGYHSFRNCLCRVDVDPVPGSLGTSTSFLSIDAEEPAIDWRDDDLAGPVSQTTQQANYLYINKSSFVHNSQIFADGSFRTNGIASIGGGNITGTRKVAAKLGGWEDVVFYPAPPVASSVQNSEIGGQYMFWRNVKASMGAGGDIGASTGTGQMPAGFDGPYLVETTNSRPVPTAF